jgi:formylmethanofuran dehydrogenase subunit E
VDKIEAWPEVKSWFLKLKPKREQNREALTDQMVEAGISLCGIITVRVLPLFLQKRGKGEIAHCPFCGEAYPKNHGPVCLAARIGHPTSDPQKDAVPILAIHLPC